MKWLVCKVEREFNCIIECVQVCDTYEEAEEAKKLFQEIVYIIHGDFNYIVINSDQIGEITTNDHQK